MPSLMFFFPLEGTHPGNYSSILVTLVSYRNMVRGQSTKILYKLVGLQPHSDLSQRVSLHLKSTGNHFSQSDQLNRHHLLRLIVIPTNL